MFDDIPVRVWLLVAIGAMAYGPTRYIVSHLNRRSDARDVLRPARSLEDQAPRLLARNSAFLAALIALAVFIYTPAAAQFAKSPSFWLLAMTACGAWSLFTVFKGARSGQIEPFARGFNDTYERHSMPKRFWVSISWNAIFGLICFWIGFQMIGQASLDACYNRSNGKSPQSALDACDKAIHAAKSGDAELAGLLAARGVAYHTLENYERAMIDYDAALRLDPHDSASHFNRGLISELRGNMSYAIAEYRAAVREDPDNTEARQRLTEAQKSN